MKVFKNKVFLILSPVLLLSMVITLACAPSSPQIQEKPTPPVSPVSTPTGTAPQVATPPATPTPPPEQPTSFVANTYTNDEVGLSIKYPNGWVINENRGTLVLYATANNKPDFDAVAVSVIPAITDFAAAAMKGLNTENIIDAKIVSTKSTTLADGQTPAYETVITGNLPTVLKSERYYYCLGTNKGNKTIIVIASTLNIEGHKSLMAEIAHTIRLK